MSLTVITNNVPRFTIDAHELTDSERAGFDYIDWPAIDAGEDSATFARYKGNLIDLSEIMSAPADLSSLGWHGYSPDSFFSGILVKFPEDDMDSVIFGRYYQ